MKKIRRTILSILIVIAMLVPTSMLTMTSDAATTLLWPVPGHTATSRGWIDNPGTENDHLAIDINDRSINGSTIVAAIGGQVVAKYMCGIQPHSINPYDCSCNGYGYGIVIHGDDGRWYQYAHMQAGSIPANVYYGSYVTTGTVLGKVGSTGAATGPHLHFQICTQSQSRGAVNPSNETYIYDISEFNKPYLDVNAMLDGVDKGVLDGIATFDVYINGSLVADDQTDYYIAHPKGTTYLINDIKPIGCHVLTGVPSISGTLNSNTDCRFVFETMHTFDGGVITTAPTCTEKGIKTISCINCSVTQTEEVEPSGHNYVATRIAPTCTENAKYVYICSACNNSYVETVSDEDLWSEWSEEKPNVDEEKTESKTQYRYMGIETKVINEAELVGWTLVDKYWSDGETENVQYVSSFPSGFADYNSLYQQYNKTVPEAYENDTKKVVVGNATTAGYIYWHWCSSYYNGNSPINRLINDYYTGWDAGSSRPYDVFHAFYSTEYKAITPSAGAVDFYNSNACNQTYWWHNSIPVMSVPVTTYEMLYEYTRETQWGEWTDKTPSDADEKYETREIYRYSDSSDLAGHMWDNGTMVNNEIIYTCLSCGETKTAVPAVPENPTTPEETTKPEEPTTPEETTKPEEPTTPDYTPGDVNNDGKITASDARLALRISAGLELPTDMQKYAADVTGDGKITAADARKILRASAGLEKL